MDAQRGIGTFVVWDYVVFAGMLLISAAIGIYYAFAGGGQQTSKDFLMGGRSMTAVPVALSLTASFMSAVTILGTPSEIYRFGIMYSIFGLTYFFVVVISAEVFLPVFYRLGITSTYEYLELRFNRFVRLCGTVLFIVQTILYTGIVIYAPALALNQVTGFDLWGTVVATGVVCTFYCTLGGLKAVVWTDVFQVGIMVAGFASVIIQSAIIQGGINVILNDAYNGGRLNPWKSLYINLVGLWVILFCSVFCGLALYSRYHDCDPWTAKKVSEADQKCSSLFHCQFKLSGSEFYPASYIIHLGVLYGVLCIGMAALASLMGTLLQGAIFGLLTGFVISLWVGIGAQLYPPLPERTMPLPLETYGCNSTYNGTNLMMATAIPFSTSAFQVHNVERTPLMDNWYSLSYLYFSTLGTFTTIFVGILVSLPTGGRKQNLDPRFLLTKQDFLSNFDIFKKKQHDISYKSHPVEDLGTDNPAFNHIELNFTDQSGKVNGTHL
ncbi:Sodium-coupled monocarboxylate transporter 1 [Sciurus carolinensis]|uniref:Sodium-coupled monocarboxylate transporter 1 n=1 Tax=Sciurus carolinensis TaxID=30640 RepID=A0AA41NAC4_SCICA|nr:Sodium-coupled monocarboxylate transporter 1 [Sciurus carolinensis]